jgi:hypothetical protein
MPLSDNSNKQTPSTGRKQVATKLLQVVTPRLIKTGISLVLYSLCSSPYLYGSPPMKVEIHISIIKAAEAKEPQ